MARSNEVERSLEYRAGQNEDAKEMLNEVIQWKAKIVYQRLYISYRRCLYARI